MSETIRIQKLLADWGIASRRAIEKMIDDGRIEVNGNTLSTKGFIVNLKELPKIKIDGTEVKKKSISDTIYMLHKPIGVICTLKDELGRKSIIDYIPKDKRLYPVGRLDADTTGLLLITNHGELTHRLLHPSFKIEKEYIVKTDGSSLTRQERELFRSGIRLEDGITAPCQLRSLKTPQTYSVIIKEGKKRQVRRMFEELGRKVKVLHRVRFGLLNIGSLKVGDIRPLTKKEKDSLLKAAGLLISSKDTKATTTIRTKK